MHIYKKGPCYTRNVTGTRFFYMNENRPSEMTDMPFNSLEWITATL